MITRQSRYYDGENTTVRWWKHDSISLYNHRTVVLSRFRYRTVALSSSYCRVITIVLSRYHHRTIALSLSYCRVIIIVLSRYHHRTVALSLSYCRVIIIVMSRFSYRCFVNSHFHYRTIEYRVSDQHIHRRWHEMALTEFCIFLRITNFQIGKKCWNKISIKAYQKVQQTYCFDI